MVLWAVTLWVWDVSLLDLSLERTAAPKTLYCRSTWVLKLPELMDLFAAAILHTLFELIFFLVYFSWELSYCLDAESWPHCTREALAESWRSFAVGMAACWIIAGLRSGWQHPASSAGAKLLSAPCLCHIHPQGASLCLFLVAMQLSKLLFFPLASNVSGKTNSTS